MGAKRLKIKITRHCNCEHDNNEIFKYPRKGLTAQVFEVGEELEVKNEWSNCYGHYYRCTTPKGYADIEKMNAEPIE